MVTESARKKCAFGASSTSGSLIVESAMHMDWFFAMVPPRPSDLWAFYVLAVLWIGIFGFVFVMNRWFGPGSDDEGHRGL